MNGLRRASHDQWSDSKYDRKTVNIHYPKIAKLEKDGGDWWSAIVNLCLSYRDLVADHDRSTSRPSNLQMELFEVYRRRSADQDWRTVIGDQIITRGHQDGSLLQAESLDRPPTVFRFNFCVTTINHSIVYIPSDNSQKSIPTIKMCEVCPFKDNAEIGEAAQRRPQRRGALWKLRQTRSEHQASRDPD
jgi:hypothetical protein